MSKISHVDEDSFQEEVLNSKSRVIVDFSATWCGPCKAQMPILEKFAEANDTVKVVKVDIDESPTIASKYGVRSIPSLVVFDNGERVTTKVGLTSQAGLETLITIKKS